MRVLQCKFNVNVIVNVYTKVNIGVCIVQMSAFVNGYSYAFGSKRMRKFPYRSMYECERRAVNDCVGM